MKFEKKTVIRTLGILGFAVALAGFTAKVDTNPSLRNNTFGLQSSAGVSAAIGNSDNLSLAGVSGATGTGSVGIVDMENALVGQGQYQTFGYKNLGLAVIEKGNLNVRKTASADGAVVGKMTNYAACEILGEENGFYQIQSGNVEGYVSAEFIITGEEALVIAQDEAKKMAHVKTDVLRVRKEATTESRTLSLVNEDEYLIVTEELDGWVKVEVDDYEGYVSAEFVEVSVRLKTGNTLKELRRGNGISDTRVDLVNYALQFVGNRYVWGGTSLTKGVDCSGFTMRVYQKFGISLPRHSGSQPSVGRKISRDEIRPGDLIFYGNGKRINHVAIYIGNGQVVHASNARDGIKISRAFYRTPVCIVSYLP